MKIIDLKKANIVLLVMAIFMSCQVSVLASAGHTTVKIPVKQVWDSEVSDISDEFSYVMTTDRTMLLCRLAAGGSSTFGL